MYDKEQCSRCRYSVLLNENTYCCEYILIERKRRGCYGPAFVKSLKRGHQHERHRSRKAGSFMNKSIFENDSLEKCYICGKWGKVDEHHVFGGSCRKTSDRYGLVVHLCRECHSLIHDSEKGREMKTYLHQRGQMIYEERFGNRQAFIREFIRSYL